MGSSFWDLYFFLLNEFCRDAGEKNILKKLYKSDSVPKKFEDFRYSGESQGIHSANKHRSASKLISLNFQGYHHKKEKCTPFVGCAAATGAARKKSWFSGVKQPKGEKPNNSILCWLSNFFS